MEFVQVVMETGERRELSLHNDNWAISITTEETPSAEVAWEMQLKAKKRFM